MGKVIRKEVCLTFDIDLENYVGTISESNNDEMELCFPIMKNCLKKIPGIKSTWFIRIDSQIKDRYGNELYVFKKHRDKIDWLLENEHEIGWHHHAYKKQQGQWVQNTAIEEVCEDLYKYGSLAAKMGIKVARMGWGFHNNETMKTLNDIGFIIDSSAIPRPQYKWEKTKKDWSITTQSAYHPSISDYRKAGSPSYEILEIPINTVFIPAASDSQKVMRYINPAYHTDKFREAILKCDDIDPLVTITHPYEIYPSTENKHALLAFNPNVFYENLHWLSNQEIIFKTISKLNCQ